ncbi:DUF4832 domain-containing protein [Portibacter lacus]|uniref:Fibronectin type-III domain-containing protein n=1 Tax=Portibacter lacus TaxID=1099794 RepID=A0AA37SQ57_9BACT|nr:DUF4832 domain-containing protein [Portibacter lacus]GLR17587.1 hypothetical protein GCM10007940_22020 [Portibacter lacus]
MKSRLFLVFIFAFNFAIAQDVVEKEYASSDEVISNPERGFYKHTEVHSANYQNLNVETLRSYREQDQITLILRVFYLEDFVGKPISQSYLDNMAKDFNVLRKAGLKAVVRFAYTKRSSAPYGDAKPEMVYTHVRQLKGIFNAHSDVISVVQTGLVGAWGEWYYTDHFAGFSPSDIKPEHWEARGNVVFELLDALPENRMIQLRTPNFKMRIFDTQEPLSDLNAFNGSDLSRVGHHNDCFVASANDVGTYGNPSVEKPYLEEETKYTPMGGETCGLAPPYSDCEFATSELERFHWSYLNIDYHGSVLSAWKDQGCFDDVERRLGYRIKLVSAKLSPEINSKGSVSLELNLQNDGYANPYNYRSYEVVLENKATGKSYRYLSKDDIREWPIGEVFSVNVEAGLPVDVELGAYEVYLSFPDGSPSLADELAYNIRLANDDIWDENTGMHNLGLTLNVSAENESDVYNGELYFSDVDEAKVEVVGPTEIFQGSGNLSNLIFWGRDTSFQYRNVLRAEQDMPYVNVGVIPASLDYFQDVDVQEGVSYSYKYVLEDVSERTYESDVVEVLTQSYEEGLNEIVVDGQDEDWADIAPVASALSVEQKAYILRANFSVDSLFVGLYGTVENYSVFLNTDNDLSTGSMDGSPADGADFLIRDGALFFFDGDSWLLEADELSIVGNDGILEIGFPYVYFSNIGENAAIPVYALINEGGVALGGEKDDPSYIIRKLPPDLPGNFEVSNSSAFPDSRLEIRWEACERCDLYSLERSSDGQGYEVIKELAQSKDFFYDDFLENGVYYYRIQTRNELGWSVYTEPKTGIIGGSSTVDIFKNTLPLKFLPNPSQSEIIFEQQIDNLQIFDLSGRLIKAYENQVTKLDISQLKKGMYLLKSRKDDQLLISKLIKI